MVLKETPIFIPIIPEFTPNWKIEITHDDTTTDVTSRTYRGEFIRRILRLGVGQFKLKLNNVGAIYSDSFSEGDIVKFYADLTDGSTQKFYGIIDTIKETIEKGQFLIIEGRHRSYLIVETWISKLVETSTEIYTITNEIIDDHFPTFTRTNVSTGVDTSIKKTWDGQKVIKIFGELCVLGDADGYVDDDLDLHLFVENSIFNEDIAIVQGINLIGGVKGFGIDKYSERDRVTVVGDDGEGLPVLYTSGTGTRQMRPVYNRNVSDMTSGKELADALLSEIQNPPPKGKVLSYGLVYVEIGENIIVSSPRQHIHDAYKIIQIKDMVGKEIRNRWLSECLIEKEFIGTTELIETNIKREDEIIKLQNPNNLEFSYNFTFKDDTYCNHSKTETEDSKLRLILGQTSGTMTSDAQNATNNITQVELKLKGSDLRGSTFRISVDNGITWQTVVRDTLYSTTATGKKLKIEVKLNADIDAYPDPSVDSLVILYK